MNALYEPRMEPVISGVKKIKVWDMNEYHYHNAYEIYLVTDGDREFVINGKTYILQAGDLAIIEPYVLHYTKAHNSHTISRWLFDFPQESLGIVFSEKETSYALKEMRSCIIHINNEEKVWFSNQLRQMMECFSSHEIIRRKIAVAMTVQLIFRLREFESATENIPVQRNVLRKDVLEAMRYIHDNFTNTEFALKDVLNYVHMSKSRFSELFKQTTGVTYLKYLSYVRATAVKRELISGHDSISAISERNGFSEVQKMTRVFNEIYGMSPTKYRRMFRDTVIDE